MGLDLVNAAHFFFFFWGGGSSTGLPTITNPQMLGLRIFSSITKLVASASRQLLSPAPRRTHGDRQEQYSQCMTARLRRSQNKQRLHTSAALTVLSAAAVLPKLSH